MLLLLTQWLAEDIRAFNVFSYITLRAVLATLTSLVISFMRSQTRAALETWSGIRETQREISWVRERISLGVRTKVARASMVG